MKKIITCSIALSLLALPMASALAYPPPCERGHFFIAGDCKTRSQVKPLRAPSLKRRYERIQANMANIPRERRVVRSFATHPTSVRARDRDFNPFFNFPASSRKYDPGLKTVSLNLRRMKVGRRRLGPAATRVDFSPAARWTRRTKQIFFNVNENPLKGLRARRGY